VGDRLAAAGAGSLEVRPWEDAHLRDGRLDQNRMLALLVEAMARGRPRAFL
jgi:hypothetical protein